MTSSTTLVLPQKMAITDRAANSEEGDYYFLREPLRGLALAYLSHFYHMLRPISILGGYLFGPYELFELIKQFLSKIKVNLV